LLQSRYAAHMTLRAMQQNLWADATAPIAALTPAIVALGLASFAAALGIATHAPNPFAPRVNTARPVAKPVAPKPVTPTYTIKSVLPSKTLNHGDWRWDESQAPATGPVFVAVDLASQTLTVFRDGHAIGVAVVVFGDDRAETPLGDFKVIFRKARHFSSKYAGAPMPYTLRLTQDGVAIHGTPEVAEDLASHGCIGLPIPFARKLFNQVQMGDPVRITNGIFLKVGDVLALPATQPDKEASPRSTRAT
jgi:lipoprotein-anchoring transpeptidase ErfK/SrfK